MTAQELYEELKEAAQAFGVGFHGMHLIQVTIQGTSLVFTHGGWRREVPIPTNQA